MCVAPVLSPWEAHEHPHNIARPINIEVDGAVQPAPAPRFSKTPSAVSKLPSPPGADTVSGLVEWGVDEGVVASFASQARLVESGHAPRDRWAVCNPGDHVGVGRAAFM